MAHDHKPETPETTTKSCFGDCFYGAATVGERGQVVIPAEARHKLGIAPGDKLLIMRHPELAGVMMFKLDSLQGFMEEFMRRIAMITTEEPEEKP